MHHQLDAIGWTRSRLCVVMDLSHTPCLPDPRCRDMETGTVLFAANSRATLKDTSERDLN